MAMKTNTPEAGSETTIPGGDDPGERQRMIREAAYLRYAQRGYAPGHDLDDWLAAEAELAQGGAGQRAPEPAETPEFEVQQGGMHGFREDEALNLETAVDRSFVPGIA